jgi:integrase
MPIIELSDRFCRTAPPPPPCKPYIIYWDTKVKGFGFRRTRCSGSFVFEYRWDGRNPRYTIGTFADPWSTTEARARARELKKLVDRGEDPQAERVERRRAAKVKDLVERWRLEHSLRNRPRTRQQNEYMLAQWIIPELGNKLISEVDHAMINRLHLKIGHTGKRRPTPYRANRVIALLSRLFSLAVLWGMRPDNPVKGVERFVESERERPFVDDEFERLLVALDVEPDRTAVTTIRLLLLTGARCNELLSASWGQLELDGKAEPPRGVWTKPATNTKQKRNHRTPLAPPATVAFLDLKRQLGVAVLPQAYLFPGLQEHGYHRVIRPAWLRIAKAAGLTGLRLNDLRHHFATVLAGDNNSLEIIGRLLGHSVPATTKRYVHLLDGPLQHAANHFGDAFTAAARRKPQ